jgi:hypothetical protein
MTRIQRIKTPWFHIEWGWPFWWFTGWAGWLWCPLGMSMEGWAIRVMGVTAVLPRSGRRERKTRDDLRIWYRSYRRWHAVGRVATNWHV